MYLLVIVLQPPLPYPLHDESLVHGPDVAPSAADLVVGLHGGYCCPFGWIYFFLQETPEIK